MFRILRSYNFEIFVYFFTLDTAISTKNFFVLRASRVEKFIRVCFLLTLYSDFVKDLQQFEFKAWVSRFRILIFDFYNFEISKILIWFLSLVILSSRNF